MSSFVQGLVQKVVASVRLGGGLAPDFPYETDRLLVAAADSGGGGLWSVYAGHAVKKVCQLFSPALSSVSSDGPSRRMESRTP